MIVTFGCHCAYIDFKTDAFVVHEPKWSLILGFSGAGFGFLARLFSTNIFLDDRKQQLEFINETLDIKKIEYLAPRAHLAPKQAETNVSM